MQIGIGLPSCGGRRVLVSLALAAALGCGGTEPPDDGGGDGPAILLMSPRGVENGRSDFTLAVYGKGFEPGVQVLWNGQPRTMVGGSTNVIVVVIPASDVAAAGTARVTVRLPDGSASPPATFTIGQALEPEMTLTSLSPDHATAGSDTIEVTVTGTGFVEGTELLLDFQNMTTTLVSSTTLRATVPREVLTEHKIMEAQVGVAGFFFSPDIRQWEVRAEVPLAGSLQPASVGVGSVELQVDVLGAGFASNSVVTLDAVDLPTTFVDGTHLVALFPEPALGRPGNLAVAVRTPEPGGGTSPTLFFTVTNEAPTLAPLALLGVTAGRPGFTLVVHGEHFAGSTLVEWNGSARGTTWRSGRRLFATINADDIAAPGTATITVRTPGLPASAPRTLTILPAPAATLTSVKTLALPVPWLTTDPVSGRLYASVSGSAGSNGNTVSEIDPDAPAVAASVFVGSEPTVVEASDDGQYLYVALDGAQGVRRVALPGLVPGLQFMLDSHTAEELHVMPGAAGTVAISRRDAGFSPSYAGIFIYDDGVARPLGDPGFTGGNTFGWGADGGSIYSFDFETTGHGLQRLSVASDGVRQEWVKGGLLDGFWTRLQVAGDRIYGGDGSVVDVDLRERLGSCPMSGWVTVDRTLGRAFFWSDTKIRVCDLATYQSLGELDLPVTGGPSAFDRHNIVRWGSDGLAFSDGATVYLVRTPLAAE
jgi:DNA-binding beta-propeller fold protein YncE